MDFHKLSTDEQQEVLVYQYLDGGDREPLYSRAALAVLYTEPTLLVQLANNLKDPKHLN